MVEGALRTELGRVFIQWNDLKKNRPLQNKYLIQIDQTIKIFIGILLLTIFFVLFQKSFALLFKLIWFDL